MPFWLKKSDFFIRTVSSHRLRDAGRSSGVNGYENFSIETQGAYDQQSLFEIF
ncbi:MAG: hypothetical protein KME64_30080 [Scytonematopsis contorta HA4267-MV1]|jgi:hypothetical protein|nr:hypothetical protein [Scytonematopsis contorta HA4267-MV1]